MDDEQSCDDQHPQTQGQWLAASSVIQPAQLRSALPSSPPQRTEQREIGRHLPDEDVYKRQDWDRYMQLLLSPLPSDVDPGTDGAPIVLRPGYAKNLQKGTYCYGATGGDCRDVTESPANFVYLRTAPDAMLSLIHI